MRILVSSLVDVQKSSHNSRLHQFLVNLCEHHEITVISINDWWKKEWDKSTDCYYQDFLGKFQNINFVYLSEKKISPVLQDLFSPIFIHETAKKIDFSNFDIHFNYNSLYSGNTISRILNFYDIPTIFDIADDLPEMIRTSPQIPVPLHYFGAWLGKKKMYNNVKIAKKVTITTESICRVYQLPKEKTVVLPNGVDTSHFLRRDSLSIKKKYGIESSFIIGFVGVLREWVDFYPLFKAIQQLNKKIDIKLLVVGGGIGYDETVKMVNQHGIHKNTIFTGTIPYQQIPEYISSMDVGVIPFKQDSVSKNSLPLKLFEYMACEIPVITTPLETVQDKFKNDVLFASDANDYQDAILHLYKNDELRRTLGSNGRTIVENNYQWGFLSKYLETLFKTVCEGK